MLVTHKMNIATGRPMNSWIIFSLSVFFFLSEAKACSFKQEVLKVFSLSGPMTVVLDKLDLLGQAKLKGVSIFHPVGESFKGKVIPGGLFLSRELAQEMIGGIVFFDEGAELKRMFSSIAVKSVPIRSRDLSPAEVNEKVIVALDPYLQNCEAKIQSLRLLVSELEERLIQKTPLKFSAIFFLGHLKAHRYPEMIMSHDGAVKFLKEKKKLVSYPSDLAYVNWSAKILERLKGSTLFVGLKDSGRSLEKKVDRFQGGINLTYPGVLIPGISQLHGFHFLVDYISESPAGH
jgi:hypothetical protein